MSAENARSRDLVHTWPHLVYRELCALLAASVVLWIVSLLVDAPLEELANATLTPNPAKAPWYFLGLQELLVYFDPWIAGVAIPGLIILGLAAIPYLDPGEDGSRRRFALSVYLGGLALWFVLIFIGTYCRGPNWAWYWPWEDQTVIKPTLPLTRALSPAIGWPAVLIYLGGGLLAPRLIWRDFFARLGIVRYLTVMGLLLLMIAVPLKIALRLAFNVKYVLTTPWFNV